MNYDKTEPIKIGMRSLFNEPIYAMVHVVITEDKPSPEIKIEGIYEGNTKLKKFKGIVFTV